MTRPWSLNRRATAIVIYGITALLWSTFNDFHGAGRALWWPRGHDATTFLIQLCGPLSWAYSALTPSVSATIGQTVGGLLFALAVWATWIAVLLKTPIGLAGSRLHVRIALAWFCLGNFVVGFALWLANA